MPSRAAQREATRVAIIAAAEIAFAERGYAGARVEAIAQAAGIRRASLFHHFADKRALYAAVVEERVLPYFVRVDALLGATANVDFAKTVPSAQSKTLEAITKAIALQGRIFADGAVTARIILREIVDDDPERPSVLQARIAPLIDRLAQYLDALRRDGRLDPVDPQTLITAVAGAALLHAIAQPILPSRSELDEARRTERHERELALLVARLLGLPEAPN